MWSRASGRPAPCATSTSPRPAASSTASVFSVACSTEMFPITHVAPISRPRVRRSRRAARGRHPPRCRRRGSGDGAPWRAQGTQGGGRRTLRAGGLEREPDQLRRDVAAHPRACPRGDTSPWSINTWIASPSTTAPIWIPSSSASRPPGTRRSTGRGGRCPRSSAATGGSGPRVPSPSPDRGAPGPRSPPRAPIRPGTRTRGADPGPRARSTDRAAHVRKGSSGARARAGGRTGRSRR